MMDSIVSLFSSKLTYILKHTVTCLEGFFYLDLLILFFEGMRGNFTTSSTGIAQLSKHMMDAHWGLLLACVSFLSRMSFLSRVSLSPCMLFCHMCHFCHPCLVRFQPIQTSSDRNRQAETSKLVQIESDWPRPFQTGLNQSRPVQTDSDWLRPVPARSD